MFFMLTTIAWSQSVINKDALKTLKIINEKTINTANEESSPAFVGDKVGIAFTNAPKSKNSESYFEIGFCTVNVDNTLHSIELCNKRINSEWHEGPMAYNPYQNSLLFTRSHKETKKIKGLETDTLYVSLRIMSADLNAAKPEVSPISLNVDRYSVCHPALLADGKTLIYASNKSGGFGNLDLYMAYFNGVEWTGSINLGPNINTAENEGFPSILNDSILIFASRKPGGYGNWDMYVSVLRNGVWEMPELLPTPFNSPFDDLGLIVRESGKSGYFASNRPGGKGKDDIYRFEALAPVFTTEPVVFATSSVSVLDKLTLNGIPNANLIITPLDVDINNFAMSGYNVDMLSGKDPGDLILKLTPKKGKSYPVIITDSLGMASFQLKKGQKYMVKTSAEGYAETSLIYDYSVFGPTFNMVMEPEDNKEPVEQENEMTNEVTVKEKTGLRIPTENGASVIFENIYYDYNSAVIQTGAASELDLLAKTMEDNPEMKVRLEAHTDCRGAAAYNLQLSINRANAARKYLVDLGINEDRIKIRGYGESNLRNECKDHVPCSESKHKFNRRTEVIIEN